MRDRDQRAGGVEQADEEEREDHRQRGEREVALEVERQEGRREAGRQRRHSPERRHAERDTGRGYAEDRQQDGARHPPCVERHHHDEAERRQDGGGRAKVADGDVGILRRRNDAGVLESDHAEEQADAGGDRHLLRPRNAVDDPRPQRRDAGGDEQEAGQEDRAERRLPRQAEPDHHPIGEEGVGPHAGSEGDRIIRRERHDERSDRGRDTGGDEYRAAVHAGIAEDQRVDEHDVGHRHERGDSSHHLAADAAALPPDAEEPFDHCGTLRGLDLESQCRKNRAIAAMPIAQCRIEVQASHWRPPM